jgi:hypothetical protein
MTWTCFNGFQLTLKEFLSNSQHKALRKAVSNHIWMSDLVAFVAGDEVNGRFEN